MTRNRTHDQLRERLFDGLHCYEETLLRGYQQEENISSKISFLLLPF